MNLGLDEVLNQEEEKKDEVVQMKPKRLPFATWEVGGNEYKLKLKTAVICQIESKLGDNLLSIVTKGEIPPLFIMLTIVQGAAQAYHHNLKYADVQNLFDTYCEEGGTQLTLFADVVMPIMIASGFFTVRQAEMMQEKMEALKELL